ncbi:MAG: GGDEF domain-containing protein [Planctomycetota bacterium]
MNYATDPESLIVLVGCSIATVAIGFVFGFLGGRWYTLGNEPRKLRKDREKTLEALTSLLSSTNKLNEDVDVHNAALVEAERDLSAIQVGGEVENLQTRLLSDITTMVHSNRKLENELVQSRYQLEKQAEELDKRKKEARTDGLCQTGNRKAFDEAIQYMLSKKAAKNRGFALMLIDVDKFKRINDTFGHSAGDGVLVNIGDALKASVRPSDMVCRLGGDEFAVILDNTDDGDVALVGSRIRSYIENIDFMVGEQNESTVVTMSMGLTAVRDGDTARSIYDRADEALYESKSRGRNRLTLKQEHAEEEFEEEEQPQKTYEELKAEIIARQA